MDEDKSSFWIEMTEYDIDAAKVMQKSGKYLYVGFLCHLAAEKALKAVIAKNGTIPPKIHALNRLAELGGLKDILSNEHKILINDLQPLHIEARYQSYKNKIMELLSKRYCADLINRTEEFIVWIKKQL